MPMPLFSNLSGLYKGLHSSLAASGGSSGEGTVMGQGPFGVKYYLSGALAGGICCGLTTVPSRQWMS